MNNINHKLENDINIKEYEKAIRNNNYEEFYKNLKNDFNIIRRVLDEKNLNDDENYFNFLISLWRNMRKNEGELSLDFYIEKYLENKVSFKFENYKEYYRRNTEKIFIEESDDPEVITMRNNIYIHQRAIGRLILEDVKMQFNIKDEDIEIERFLNKIGTSSSSLFNKATNSYLVDFYGNYVDTSIRYQPLNYFFYVYILTKSFMIIKPININYKSLYYNDNKEVVRKIFLSDINKIKFVEECKTINFVLKSKKTIYMYITNYGLYRLKDDLEKYCEDKKITFEMKDINNNQQKRKTGGVKAMYLACFFIIAFITVNSVIVTKI